jgi:type III restriction enzyme
MIRRTIKEHLDKELRLARAVSKSELVFIDHVEKYRNTTKDGHSIKSDYARIFEEIHPLDKHPDYRS